MQVATMENLNHLTRFALLNVPSSFYCYLKMAVLKGVVQQTSSQIWQHGRKLLTYEYFSSPYCCLVGSEKMLRKLKLTVSTHFLHSKEIHTLSSSPGLTFILQDSKIKKDALGGTYCSRGENLKATNPQP
jgi:hypothetical protein